MNELTLARSDDDRRRFDLAGVGSLRRLRRLSSDTELRTVDGATFRASTSGLWHPRAQATEESGRAAGTYEQTSRWGHDGSVQWRDSSFALARDARWKHRFALTAAGTTIVQVESSGRPRKPSTVGIEQEQTDPGLVLFTVFLVQVFLAQDFAVIAGGT